MSPKRNLRETVEERLAALHNRKHCVLVSRGAVAIYLAIKALEQKRGKVILPSILCFSPANAVLYAGMEPVYADISLADFNLDIRSVENILKKEKDVRAIVLPHIYGQPADIDAFAALARQHKVLLIEDAAQAMGGEYKGKPLGSFGDFSVLSFGHTKIVDAGGGGALLFDDSAYERPIRKLNAAIPRRAANYKELQEAYSTIYYALAPFARKDQYFGRLYYSFPHLFKDLYLYRDLEPSLVRGISAGMKGLRRSVEIRNENAAYYRTYLRHGKIVHPTHKWNGVTWRYSFLIKSRHQQEIAEDLRRHGVPVSNWYPPLHRYFELDPKRLKNAEYTGGHIFNLWVEPPASRKNIQKTCSLLLDIIDNYRG